MKEIRDLLFSILRVVNYTGDREYFVNTFVESCHEETFAELFERLPVERQEVVRERVKAVRSVEDTHLLLKEYFTVEEYTGTFMKIFDKNLRDYFKTVEDLLTVEQKEKLKEVYLFEEVKS